MQSERCKMEFVIMSRSQTEKGDIRSAPRGERPAAEAHILLRSQTDRHVPPSVPYCDAKHTHTHTHLHSLPFIFP